MTKTRVANILMFDGKKVIKPGGNLPIVAVLTGTGTASGQSVITVLAADVATRAYVNIVASTNIATIVGTAA